MKENAKIFKKNERRATWSDCLLDFNMSSVYVSVVIISG